jgi:purine-binding chemotaxis protein CheW
MSGTDSGGAGRDDVAFVTLTLGEQLCGVPVLCVRDVLADQTIARIPLAPPEVAGNLNLRGRIVTAIDLRARLRLKPRLAGSAAMSLVTEQGSELYALLVDQVSEVLILPRSGMEANPPTLPATWADFCEGIYRLEQGLMVVLSVERLLALDLAAAA